MNCKECSKEIDEGSSFCKNCGKKIEVDSTIKEMREITNLIREMILLDSWFYYENPELLVKFRKFAKKATKFLDELKKQGKFEEFAERYKKEGSNVFKEAQKKEIKIK